MPRTKAPTRPPFVGHPDLCTTTGEHTTITTRVGNDAITACTCKHRCTNPAHAAAWAHSDHTRTHAPWRRA